MSEGILEETYDRLGLNGHMPARQTLTKAYHRCLLDRTARVR